MGVQFYHHMVISNSTLHKPVGDSSHAIPKRGRGSEDKLEEVQVKKKKAFASTS
jgi:hypothetical protein